MILESASLNIMDAQRTRDCGGHGWVVVLAWQQLMSISISSLQASKDQSAIKFGSAVGECGTYR